MSVQGNHVQRPWKSYPEKEIHRHRAAVLGVHSPIIGAADAGSVGAGAACWVGFPSGTGRRASLLDAGVAAPTPASGNYVVAH